MSSEAVVRIRLDGGRQPGPGGASGAAPGAAPPPAGRQPPAQQTDPYAEVRKRQTRETTDTLDAVAAMTKQFRSQLGGVFGGLLGAVLDMTLAWQALQKNLPRIPPRIPTVTLAPPAAPAAAPSQAAAGAAMRESFEQYQRAADYGLLGFLGKRNKPTGPPVMRAVPTTNYYARRQRQAQEYGLQGFIGRLAAAPAPGSTPPAQPTATTSAPAAKPVSTPQQTRSPAQGPTEVGSAAQSIGGALPVIGAIVAAFEGVRRVTFRTIDAMGNFTAALTSSVTPAEIFQGTAQGLNELSAGLFYVNPLFGILGKTVATTIDVMGQITRNVDALVPRYAAFNAGIAQAQAQAEVREILGDLRRSRQLQGEMVAYIEAQSKFQQSFEELKTRFIGAFLPAITNIINGLNTIVAAIPGATADERLVQDPLETMIRAQLADDLGTEGITVP